MAGTITLRELLALDPDSWRVVPKRRKGRKSLPEPKKRVRPADRLYGKYEAQRGNRMPIEDWYGLDADHHLYNMQPDDPEFSKHVYDPELDEIEAKLTALDADKLDPAGP